jgi:chemotaxis protein histidine kinase CheA/ActR/RegA family two-component response regulator
VKLNDLIEALAGEIETMAGELERCLVPLTSLESDAPEFVDALDQYSGLAQRTGEAAEMAGFPGLQAVCEHVVENTLLAAVFEPHERAPLLAFLRAWPALMVHYLRHIDDPSCAAGLVDRLREAPSPMSEAQGLKVAHMLGSMPSQAHSAFGDDEPRPVLARPEDVALVVPDDVDQALIEGFFHEAPEQARYLVDLAHNLAAGTGDSSDLTAAKRVVHTMKGSGSIIGLRGLTTLGHHLEDILEHFEHKGGSVAKVAADVLLDAAFCLEQMVNHVLGEDEMPQLSQAVLQSVLDLANRIDRGESLEAPISRVMATQDMLAAPATAALTVRPAAAVTASASTVTASPTAALRVSVERVDELFRVSGEVSVHTAAMEAHLKALTERARELLAQNLRVQKRLFEIETLVDVRSLSVMRARTQRDADAALDPLELDQYSELHGTAHALMEEAADARGIAMRLEEDIARTAAIHTRQQRLSRDLQHLVISTRMTEVGTLASRLQRNVRATCKNTGKRADLVIEGSATLIDGDVLNRLADPLLHVLRNAVDHGLETPGERHAAGKSETGRVTLAFSRQGQQVVLQCTDDGRGLDHAAIRRRAIERQMIAADQLVSDDELARLILSSGFSTRQTVSELSGRGVGLDVVREWVSAMNGSIRITSRSGQGCTIEMRFAASLSTMQALVVEVEKQRFALASVQIEQAVPRGVGQFEFVADRLVYRHANRVLPAVRLADAAGVASMEATPLAQCDAVIVRVDDKLHALAVDALIDARELLVKNPGRYARHVRAVAGLSILGDGSIAVNLDIAQLLASQSRKSVTAADAAPTAFAARSELPGVLIVDDSLSVRNSLLQMVQDAGYRATSARDGVDAIDTMREFRPNLVLTDLEMPNMNGLELTTHIRGRADLKGLPVIMVTSRSQEKHRRLAEQAGVDSYVTKPYNDGDLLQRIREALAAA